MTSGFEGVLVQMVATQRGSTAGSEGAATEGADGSGSGGGSGGAGGNPPAGNPFGGIFWILIVFFVFMIVMTSMAGRKQRKKRAEMLGGIERHDKVQTLGGMIGTVQEVTETELVLETEGTRMRFSRGAVQQVIRKGKLGVEETPSDPGSQGR